MMKSAATRQSTPLQDVSGLKDKIDDRAVTIREAQNIVDTWIQTLGVRYFSELTNLAQLVEEVGEVSRIMARTYGEQSFKSGEADADLGDELADVLFVLICIANQTGVDLTTALQKNLQKKTKRDATRHRENSKLANAPNNNDPTNNHDDQTLTES